MVEKRVSKEMETTPGGGQAGRQAGRQAGISSVYWLRKKQATKGGRSETKLRTARTVPVPAYPPRYPGMMYARHLLGPVPVHESLIHSAQFSAKLNFYANGAPLWKTLIGLGRAPMALTALAVAKLVPGDAATHSGRQCASEEMNRDIFLGRSVRGTVGVLVWPG
ncbi:hypothetical protein LX32DRAFT_649289 [Colletotrichum zoysiae]|uniref:Uncharacterized protein n=1 Tax=Colletotrichum zoysiae TaxID=1216348 RepID=A0AAD9HT84_9PEZI|nr:hypothetical protein LX32DRAFT_649289 [Colletotrichum zoysiae]